MKGKGKGEKNKGIKERKNQSEDSGRSDEEEQWVNDSSGE